MLNRQSASSQALSAADLQQPGFADSVLLWACRQLRRAVDPTWSFLVDPPTETATVAGVFVTLKRDGDLRGCYGNFGGEHDLWKAVARAAEDAALHDPRFQAVRTDELNRLDLSVTLLHDFEVVDGPAENRVRQIEIGRHGVLIRGGHRQALLLPQVAPEHGLDAEQLLEQVCLKAGLPRHAWQDEATELTRFQGWVVEGQVRQVLTQDAAQQATVRPPAVAGRFYPGTATEIEQGIHACFQGLAIEPRRMRAALVPHAGWAYSGRLAAETFAGIDWPRDVILLGPKHTGAGKPCAVMPEDQWSWPGGGLAANPELAERLTTRIPALKLDRAAHANEHCLEVELPLIAHLARPRVTGIVFDWLTESECLWFGEALAEVLAELPEPPLLVTSSDLNHFANEPENRRLDHLAMEALETLDPSTLYRTVVEEFDISMCGVCPAVIMLECLRRLKPLTQVTRVGYTNSAAVSGNRSRVVGYAGYWFEA